jgi:hypothetical protein
MLTTSFEKDMAHFMCYGEPSALRGEKGRIEDAEALAVFAQFARTGKIRCLEPRYSQFRCNAVEICWRKAQVLQVGSGERRDRIFHRLSAVGKLDEPLRSGTSPDFLFLFSNSRHWSIENARSVKCQGNRAQSSFAPDLNSGQHESQLGEIALPAL